MAYLHHHYTRKIRPPSSPAAKTLDSIPPNIFLHTSPRHNHLAIPVRIVAWCWNLSMQSLSYNYCCMFKMSVGGWIVVVQVWHHCYCYGGSDCCWKCCFRLYWREDASARAMDHQAVVSFAMGCFRPAVIIHRPPTANNADADDEATSTFATKDDDDELNSLRDRLKSFSP